MKGTCEDVTQPGEASSSLETGACEHSRSSREDPCSWEGASGPLANLPKSGTGAGREEEAVRQRLLEHPCLTETLLPALTPVPTSPLEEAMDPRTPAAPGPEAQHACGLQHNVSTHWDSDLYVHLKFYINGIIQHLLL